MLFENSIAGSKITSADEPVTNGTSNAEDAPRPPVADDLPPMTARRCIAGPSIQKQRWHAVLP